MSFAVFDTASRSFVGGPQPSEWPSADEAGQWVARAQGLAARRNAPMPEFVVMRLPGSGSQAAGADEDVALAQATVDGQVNDWVGNARRLARALLDLHNESEAS